MIDIKGISLNIRKYRTAAGLTQAQLAEKMFIAPQTVSKWERGLSVPTVAELSAISDILSVPIGVLLNELPCDKPDVMIAVDGGGTKTEFLLFTLDGESKRTVLGGSNPNVTGIKNTFELLREGIDRLLTEQMRLSAVYCGIAGAGTNDNASVLQTYLKKQYPSAKVRVESDTKNVLGLTDDPENCISVIMGTGSSVMLSTGGRLRRIGGWGYVFDGAGSGYDIGREVIRRTLAYEDGIGELTDTVRMCRERLGAPAFSQISALHDRGVNYIASFASVAFDAVRLGDSDALEIIRASTDRICELIKHAMKSLEDDPHIILSGGLCKNADIILPLLREGLGDIDIKIVDLPQIFGAVRMCTSLMGANMSRESFEKIKSRYEEELK